MSKQVKIITQTGSDFPLREAESLEISMIPDIVRFGTKEFQDRIELPGEVFYSKMEASSELPTSSHPSVGTFVKAFEAAKSLGYKEIICITVTSKMSGSHSTAVAAANMFSRRSSETKVCVYDSEQCSHGMSVLVRLAGELAEQGKSAEEIISELDSLKPRVGFYFMLNSLKNARKGGRVGAIKSLTADALGIKPLLRFENGQCIDFSIAASIASGAAAIAKLFAKEADLTKPLTLFHAGAPEKAEILKKEILKLAPDVQISTAYVGPVIGIYAGSGAVGIAFTKETGK